MGARLWPWLSFLSWAWVWRPAVVAAIPRMSRPWSSVVAEAVVAAVVAEAVVAEAVVVVVVVVAVVEAVVVERRRLRTLSPP